MRIAFLDEIFKASSSILNALLTILNERIYHNGAELQRVPMQALIAASNELPTGQEELGALYDRFLVRVFVDYVSLDSLPQLFEKTLEQASVTPFTTDELKAIQQAADKVSIPPEIVQAIQQIWQKHRETFKEDRREQLSDRRLKKVIKLLSVAAATNGRTAVDLSDVFLLKDCLWNHPDNALKVRDMIMAVLRDCSYPTVNASDNRGDIDAFLQGHSISIQEDDPYAIFNASQLTNNKSSPSKSVIKGYKGSGTQTDPILISNFQEIAGIERADVGQKGYYFKQTADIDCSVLTTWPEIVFQGHYDGGGYTISYDDNSQNCLFSHIQSQSTITSLRVQQLFLAANAFYCKISACTSDGSLIQEATNCNITACEAGRHLIANSANQCVIIQCQSGYPLIGDTAIECHINDCIAVLDCARVKDRYDFGGITWQLNQSVVECCFVTGLLEYSYYDYKFAGIAGECDSSTIRFCALGELQMHSRATLSGRIVRSKNDASLLQNNVAHDSHKGKDGKGKDGKSISAALFNQHYFEHTLGWDFDKVWQWNNTLNRPQLQSVGVGAVVNSVKQSQSASNDDLLTQQIRANIWL
ncbi:MAG: AAA family ATPase [Moraxellaceae bacterium]|nr:AAA family ATPase [Moraxellaceae bacterium]